MDWFKKHTDAMIFIGGLLSCVMWMNGQFSEVKEDLAEMKTEMAVMKTVLIMKGVFTTELAAKEIQEKN